MRAIVTGVSGQDGWFMTELLTRRGIGVVGLTHDLAAAQAVFAGSSLAPDLRVFDYSRVGAIAEVIADVEPDLIFNFAAKATGIGMFDQPFATNRLNGAFVLDILEAVRAHPARDRMTFCQASSSEMFGTVETPLQSERTPFRPKTPYGCAKLYAHNLIGVYRSTYGIRASSLILYNHESARRSVAYVTQKIASGAAAIKLGRARELALGTLDSARDWGYAPEYVEAMMAAAMLDAPADFIVATGSLSTVRDLCRVAFDHVDLDYRGYVVVSAALQRKVDHVDLCGDASAIRAATGWRARKTISEIMCEMVDHELERLGAGRPDANPTA